MTRVTPNDVINAADNSIMGKVSIRIDMPDGLIYTAKIPFNATKESRDKLKSVLKLLYAK